MSTERLVDQSLDNFWQHYEAGHLDEGAEVLANFGYDPEVVDFVFRPESHYVPDHYDDQFVDPVGVSRDQLAVVGLMDSRNYRFGYHDVHRLQESAISAAGISLDGIRATLRNEPRLITRSAKRESSLAVSKVSLKLGDGRMVASQPTMMMNFDDRQGPPEVKCPGAIMHELVHEVQMLSTPVYEGDRSVRMELEAYAVQATLLRNFQIDYSENTAYAATVDEFRKRHLGPYNFESTEGFIYALSQDPVLSRMAELI